MKDYSLSEEERKEFVLNYDVTDERLTANMADGTSFDIPNTEANVTKIEGKMIEQVKHSKRKLESLKASNLLARSILAMLLAGSAGVFIKIGNTLPIALPTIAIIDSAFIIGFANKIVKNNKIINDIRKNRYFVKKQETINRGITNTNVLANSDVKEQKRITINDMDHGYSYNNLKQIVTNTERQESFNFETFSEEEVSRKQEQIKIKVRRR